MGTAKYIKINDPENMFRKFHLNFCFVVPPPNRFFKPFRQLMTQQPDALVVAFDELNVNIESSKVR